PRSNYAPRPTTPKDLSHSKKSANQNSAANFSTTNPSTHISGRQGATWYQKHFWFRVNAPRLDDTAGRLARFDQMIWPPPLSKQSWTTPVSKLPPSTKYCWATPMVPEKKTAMLPGWPGY